MIVNLKCESCGHIYNFDVGEVSFGKNGKLAFSNKSICPKCNACDKDLLTEIGQSQMTRWFLDD